MDSVNDSGDMPRRSAASTSMDLRRVDLNLLVALQALLQERSVTRAARRIGLTQPAMSNALARLRRMLHDDLLIRDGSHLELTGRAQSLEVPLARILEAVQRQIISPDAFDPARSTRRFTIVASTSTTLTVVPQLLRIAERDAPGISFRVLPQEMRNADALLRRPDVDVVLLPNAGPTSHARERLYDETWVCLVAAGNTNVGDDLTMDDLAGLDHAFYVAEGMYTYPDLELQAHGPLRMVRVEVEDFLVLPFLVEGTNMVAVIQQRVAERMSRAAAVRVLRLPAPLPPLGIDMVWNPRVEGDPACRWLRQSLITAANSRD